MRPLLLLLSPLLSLPLLADVYLSTDGGRTWAERGPEGYVVTHLSADPKDPAGAWVVAQPTAAVLAAGEDPKFASPVLLRTADAGKTWEKNAAWKGKDPVCVAQDPEDPQVVWVGGWFETLARSPDGGRTWKAVALGKAGESGPQARQNTSRNVVCLAVRGGTILAGLAGPDDGVVVRSTDGGASWARIREDDAMTCAMFGKRVLCCARSGQVTESTDGGRTWAELRPSDYPHRGRRGEFVRSPDGQELVFCLAGTLRRCRAEGDWEDLSPPDPAEWPVSVALLKGEMLAVVRAGTVEERAGRGFVPGRVVRILARGVGGEWSERALPGRGEPRRMEAGGGGEGVWLIVE